MQYRDIRLSRGMLYSIGGSKKYSERGNMTVRLAKNKQEQRWVLWDLQRLYYLILTV